MQQTVGVIGLGLMGEVLAGRLMAAGFGVVGTDIDPAKNERLAARGGKAVAIAAEVARLRRHRARGVQHRSGRGGGRAGAAAGGEVRHGRALHQHLRPGPHRALGQRLAGSKLRFLDTPVSGTSEQVRPGDGVGLIGGDPAVAAEVAPVLDALFPRRFHIGKTGDGGRAKLAVNLILGLNRMALAEGLAFAERMGLDAKAFLAVAKGAASYSQVMDTKGEKMLARDFAPEGRVRQTLKDVHMMLDQGEKLGQALPMLQVHCDVLEACVGAGEAERDNSIIVEEIRRRRRRRA